MSKLIQVSDGSWINVENIDRIIIHKRGEELTRLGLSDVGITIHFGDGHAHNTEHHSIEEAKIEADSLALLRNQAKPNSFIERITNWLTL